MKAAVVKIIRGNVENVIVADAETDYPARGYALKPLPDDTAVTVGHQWDETEGYLPPRYFVKVDEKSIVTEVTSVLHYADDPPAGDGWEAALAGEVPKVGQYRNPDGTFDWLVPDNILPTPSPS